VHFAYFYVVWVTIQFGFKAPAFAAEASWREALKGPAGANRLRQLVTTAVHA